MNLHEPNDSWGARSPEGVGKHYGIGRTTVFEQIRAGRLRAVKLGNRTLVLREDAEAWARSLPEVKAP